MLYIKRYLYSILLCVLIGCASNSKKAAEFYEEGNLQYNKGNLIASILSYNKAIELDNKMSDAYMKRADARLSIVDYKGATEDYTKVIELDPKRADAYLNRGMIKIYKKEFTDEAISDFNKVIELNPKSPEAFYNRGVVYFVQNKRAEACQDWHHSIELGSKKAEQKIKTFCK